MVKLLEKKAIIHADCEINGSKFGKYTEVGCGSIILNSNFGDYSYCTKYCDIANTEIKKFSNIASFVRIGPTDHPMEKASLHHFLYRSNDYWDEKKIDEQFFEKRFSRKTIIGNDTWIGHGAIIKPEIVIGDGAIVGAGAVVTKNVEDYTIVVGKILTTSAITAGPPGLVRDAGRLWGRSLGQGSHLVAWRAQVCCGV